MIKIQSTVPRDSSSKTPARNLLEPAGGGIGRNFAVGDFIFSNGPVLFSMYLDPPDARPGNHEPHKTTFLAGRWEDEAINRYFDGWLHGLPEGDKWPEIMQ